MDATAADGTKHYFPDDTDPAVIDKVMKDYANSSMSLADKAANFNIFDYLGLNSPSTQPNTPSQNAMLSTLNQQDNTGQVMASEMVKGVPVGGRFVNQTPEMSQFEEQHPWGSKGLQVAGGALATAPLFTGAAIPGLWGSLGAAAGVGGLLSSADTATDQLLKNGDVDWKQLGISGLIGAGGGVAGNILGYVVGKGVGAAADRVRSMISSGAFDGVDPLAVVKFAKAAQASGLTDAEITNKLAEGGPQMFASEFGPELEGQATGVATKAGGAGQTILRNAFNARSADAANRIENAVTDAMGPRVNVVQAQLDREAARKAATGPLYEAFRNSTIAPTPEIDALMDRLDAAGALGAAAKNMKIGGNPMVNYFFTQDPLTGEMSLDSKSVPTPEFFDWAKRALDDKIGSAFRQGEKGTARLYTDLKNDTVNTIDAQTPVWKRARATWSSSAAIDNAVEAGQNMFENSTRPDQLRVDLRNLSPPELQAMLTGARDVAAGVMDRTRLGSTRELDLFQAPANQQKLRMLLQAVHGPDAGNVATDNLITSMNRERMFANSRTETIMGSQTARRLASQKDIEDPQGTLASLAHRYAFHVQPGQLLELGALPEREAAGIAGRQATMRESLARLLTSQGPAAAQNLRNALQYTVPSQTLSPATARLIELLGRTAAPAYARPHITVKPNNQQQ
jgi:hypothetical protein